MIATNPIDEVPNYGSSAQYKTLPTEEQIRAGVIPLDSLPAAWWNALWCCTNHSVNEARDAVGVLIDEINTVLTQAGVCVNPSCVDQLYRAIDAIHQRVGNASVAGSVKSSSCPGEVSIDVNGIMTANCVGNASQLTTTSKIVVGAINELKSTYDCCFSNVADSFTAMGNAKAPNMHASCDTTYGVGSAACFGHLKVSDEYTCIVGEACDGIAASQKALYCVYIEAAQAAGLGNITPLAPSSIPSAGVCNSAARSDHVHPEQTCVECAQVAYRIPTSMVCNYGPGTIWVE